MSALEKAEAAVEEAQTDTVAVQLALAAVELAKVAAAQQQAPAPAAPAKEPFDTRKWVTLGGLGIAAGLVASLFAVAVAIGAVSVAILALVLRGLWADYLKGK
ncbi:hypothetical protein [Streptomyces sp. 1-11]|uniref:hypothetical protein n=1 Tax=Streptomyces sp. 1-11 TaxID=2590549 RepID=UPI001168C8C6|nr:hypothetical protein [Streptomyces sp. 1-11]GEK03495.1 hypothetical protein TNCT1_57710 [Streptomyces sp. 1-11]